MADYGMLFQLILLALTFVIVGMAFLVYIMIIGARQKRRFQTMEVPQTAQGTTQECAHYFGYLSGYPMNQPIPEECFGCADAVNCMNEPPQEASAQTEEMAEAEEE